MKVFTLASSLFLFSFGVSKCNAFSSTTISNHHYKNGRNYAANGLKATSNKHTNNDIGVAINNDGSGITQAMSRSVFLSAGLMALAAAPAAVLAATEQASTSLDFALPSYDTKMLGFGEGSEAYVIKGSIKTSTDALMADPGKDEKEKQLASMRKAEEARKEALTKKKAEQKERDEEGARRAKEKKERDAERLKNIWNS